MPSWNDGETSSEGPLFSGEYPEGGFAPDSIEDPTFCGLALDSTYVCVVHKQLPERFVAYQGRDTGRRFLAYAVKNEAENCGFLEWVDPEWPDSLQYALSSLWSKVDELEMARIEEKCDHNLKFNNLVQEKSELEKKYTGLVAEVNKMLEESVRNVQLENYAKLNQEEKDAKKFEMTDEARIKAEAQLAEVVLENNKLKTELFVLKEVQKNQSNLTEMVVENNKLKHELFVLKAVEKNHSEVAEILEKKRHGEKDALKDEKKKLEYMLFDLLKANDVNKERLKRIKDICEELNGKN